ncbi:putative transcriptional regulatory protein pdtaR [Rubripirellula lacrimiformis]|uniref:Putative transcriptional regulatory protein pdtaR n=1 Tax=Rubripirellula lacrimiformis TaxID=1930273 RepID=A0A517N4T2_9BACT|nr:response regulator [Rubripirellula lacrimiformis]QDT02139.1 putative transcriptional regulatory protein pdtaR [Rubripirellula lacrimiformis]
MKPPTRTLRIAIADDEVDIRDYFTALLPRLGHRLVGAACNGRELVQLCLAEETDLVITDIMMPEMDGLAAAEQIARHQTELDSMVPVIVMSSHDRPQTKDKPWIVDYLVKPVTIDDLKGAIDNACHLKD